jgi:hypothetical protein
MDTTAKDVFLSLQSATTSIMQSPLHKNDKDTLTDRLKEVEMGVTKLMTLHDDEKKKMTQ